VVAMWVYSFPFDKLKTKRYGWGVCVLDDSLWYNYDAKKWQPMRNTDAAFSNVFNGVKTFKSFQRHLRKHPELQGYTVIWINRYRGLSVKAQWCEVLIRFDYQWDGDTF